MLSENLQRKDLSEVEKAEGIWEYMRCDSALSPREIAKKLGIAESYLRSLLTLHGYPSEVKQMVKNGEIAANTTIPLKQLDQT